MINKLANKQILSGLYQWLMTTEKGRQISVLVIIPALLVAFYLVLLSPDRYVSSASVLVKETGIAQMQAGLLEGLGFNAGGVSSDEQLLQAYIVSPDLLNQLEKKLGLKAHYSDSRDFIFGLSESDSYESFIGFYRKHVTVGEDSQTGLLTIRVQAYTPEFAKQLADALLVSSENFINESSQTIAKREMQFALDEITRSQSLLKKAKGAVLHFQNQHNLVSPDSEGESLFTIISELESELAKTEADVNQSESYLNADAPQVLALKSKTQALRKEIGMQKQRIIGVAEEGDRLNELSAQYQSLSLDLELATTLYTSALSAYEMARVQAGKQLKHLVVASTPQLAEAAIYPRRVYWLVTWMIATLTILFVFRIVNASLKEHKD